MMKFKITFFCFVMLTICTVRAQVIPDSNLDLYILAGQSNMAGRGVISVDVEKDGHDHVFMFNKENKWVQAKHPLHFDKPKAAGVGPGLAFGIKMAATGHTANIGLIPCAVGGTPIEHWQPDAYDAATKTHPYDDAISRIKLAMKYGTIKGIIWHQGEANSNPEKSRSYLNKLTALVKRFREVAGNPKLPFIAGELGRFNTTYTSFNKTIDAIPFLIPYTAIVSSKGLTHKGDGVHFNASSASKLGKRYAVAMRRIQKKLK